MFYQIANRIAIQKRNYCNLKRCYSYELGLFNVFFLAIVDFLLFHFIFLFRIQFILYIVHLYAFFPFQFPINYSLFFFWSFFIGNF